MASTIPNMSEIKGNLFVTNPGDSTNLGNGSIASSGTLFTNSVNSFTDSVSINVLNTIESTSTTTGSLVLEGGLGISKKLFIGGITTAQTGIVIPTANTIEFGGGVSKELNAGKIGYGTFSPGLDIVGAGVSAGSRIVTLWDNVNIVNSLSLPGTLTVTNTANISATDNGAMSVSGGVKILKDLFSNTISLPLITAPVNTDGVKFFIDTIDGKLKSINGNNQITTYNPTLNKGDLIVNNGSDLIRLPAGNLKDVLTPDPTTTAGLKWANIFDTNVEIAIFGTQYYSLSVPGRQSTTSTVFQTAATFNIPTISAGTYRISFYYEKYINSRAMVVIIQLDGVTIFRDNTEVIGVATTLGVDGATPTSGVIQQDLTLGTHTILLRYASTAGLLAREANIQNIYIEIFRLT
jgi:hypothetical protein